MTPMINVLIVDDDPMVAELNKRYVESIANFKVVAVVYNGEDALKILKSKKIELLILDIYMPKLDGISLLEEMRKNFLKTDVILVTAATEVNEIDKALKLGAVDYLIKPFDGDRIRKSLSNYFKRYNLIHGKETFKQEDIDRITNIAKSIGEQEVEKGLHKDTLRRIRDFMAKNHDLFLTSEEVSERMGLSKVTVRRYLEFLAANEEIITEIEYGSIGRPCHLYKSIKR
jgi:two-component system CitB family response regulator/two-component system response regulator DctR